MRRYGFSLVELSIVLVILGLLVGGILAGQSLIRASELRAVSAEASRYITAMQAFRDKYRAYPGDMLNATAFWGVAGGDGTGNDNACKLLVTNDVRTCNGNSDGTIAQGWEGNAFWKHLVNASLVEGQYSGAVAAYATPGMDIPRAKVESTAGWWVGASGNVSGSANAFDGAYGNTMNLFSRPAAGVVRGILAGAEAWNLDKKMDDGMPGTGRVISNYSATYSAAGVACTTATTGADYATTTYQLDKTTKDCGLFWIKL